MLNPPCWKGAESARDESGGAIEAVTDEAILDAYRLIASLEGLFVEPASAASVAGLKKMSLEGRLNQDATIVCTLTGHGLKDPSTATQSSPPPVRASADLANVRDILSI